MTPSVTQNISLAALFTLINLVYFPLNWYQHCNPKKYSVKIWLDDHLPYIPVFNLPYILSICLIAGGPYLFAALLPSLQFKPLIFSLTLDLLVSIAIWFFYPCVIDKPKHVETRQQNPLTKLILAYGRDYGNCNSFPSAHISLVTIYLYWLAIFFPSRTLLWIILGIINSFSVVLTRQHYILDVVTGLFLAAFSILIINFFIGQHLIIL